MLAAGQNTSRARAASLVGIVATAMILVLALGVETAPTAAGATPTPAPTATCQSGKVLVNGWCQAVAYDNVDAPGTEQASKKGPDKCTYQGYEFDCNVSVVGEDGGHYQNKWSPSLQCWMELYDPQPSHDSSIWEGRTEGAIVWCSAPECPNLPPLDLSGNCRSSLEWVPSWDGVSPYALALQAVSDMNLRAPEIGMTGGSPPEGMQIVGIPAWMWAADPGDSTTGPVTRYATAGSVTVTATGRLDRTEWSMGDGVTVTCDGAAAKGTPYEARYDKQPSPTCGYMYTRTSAGQPNEVFNVTVTAYWTITWSGGGQSGTITQQRARTTQKQVGELQALVVGPGDRR